ncbi:MAG: SEC-C domain-containing protein [Nitrospirae bacterium]|nr:SEC-C domain-containing protein [Nitrospirota bacterium]
MKEIISDNQWKALYQAAAEFREIEPWKFITETDVFGVKNPDTGEHGYCCIMGELGEVLALAVYLGSDGLKGYRTILEGQLSPEDSDMMYEQNCLMASFENKSDLDKKDKDLIKKLGIQAKGKKAWPMFRRHEPSYLPSSLQKDDLVFLTAVLQQAKHVCLRFKNDKTLLSPSSKDLYFFRSHDKANERWQDEWLKPEITESSPVVPAVINDIVIQRIKSKAKSTPAVWEIDFFYAPTPIKSKNKPFFPYGIMIIDSKSGFVYEMFLSEKNKYPSQFPERLLSCLEQNSFLPKEILVKKEEALNLLQPIADKLGIKLNKVVELAALETAKRSMDIHFMGKKNIEPLQYDDYCGDEVMDEQLEKSGAELSVFGLYGLFCGCLAAPNPVMPSVLLPIIFGKKGPQFKTNKEAEEIMSNIMSLFNMLAKWDSEEELLPVPDFEYDENKDGVLTRISDGLELATLFLHGLELGGMGPGKIPKKLEQSVGAIIDVIDLLGHQMKICMEKTKFNKSEMTDAMEALDAVELIIDDNIEEIHIGLKHIRIKAAKNIQSQFGPDYSQSTTSSSKIQRNEPCPCGSGKKYKKCCGLTH